jgi:predicted NUDIX family NTP pyrophosphohydrolase
MAANLRRSVSQPIRIGLTWEELWLGPDKGLIWCWERGRQKGEEEPELAARARKGELVTLAWIGGVTEKLKTEKKLGTLNYLATWQGLRGEDLDMSLDGERVIVCTRTAQNVVFSVSFPNSERSEG